MDETRLAVIRAAERKASRGPWQWHWRNDPDAPGSVSMVDQNYAIAMCPRYGASDFAANAAFIAAARTAVPELLDLVDRLQRDNQELQAENADLRAYAERVSWKYIEATHPGIDPTKVLSPELLRRLAVSDGN